MILPIILLIVIVLVLAIVILFSFYVFLPSININNKEKFDDDPIISNIERDYKLTESDKCKVNKDKRAIVLCSCHKNFKLKRAVSNNGYTCFMAKTIQGSGTDCQFACIGLGDCARKCPQQAISIVNRTAVISNMCCGCGECIDVCPQHIIKLIPRNEEKIILCNNTRNDDLTSCSARSKEIKIERNDKKDFKIWSYCYKIINKFKK